MFITTILVGSVLRLSLPLPPCDTKNHSIIFDINNSSPSRNRKALTCKHFDGAALVRSILIPLLAIIWYTDWSNSFCVLLAAGFAIGLLPSCFWWHHRLQHQRWHHENIPSTTTMTIILHISRSFWVTQYSLALFSLDLWCAMNASIVDRHICPSPSRCR